MSCSWRLPPAEGLIHELPNNNACSCVSGFRSGFSDGGRKTNATVRLPSSVECSDYDPLTTPQHRATLLANSRRGRRMKNSPINPDAVYSREEAAELLGVSLST